MDYAYCPPDSGDHYIVAGRAPLPRNFYDSNDDPTPEYWLHNLEHGWVVLLYKNDSTPGDAPSAAELSAMKAFYDSAPQSTYTPNSCLTVPNKVIAVPFNDMTTRFALLAWDRALLTDTFDPQQALTFYTQWVDSPQAAEHGIC